LHAATNSIIAKMSGRLTDKRRVRDEEKSERAEERWLADS
jgi:hypothetical protein